MRHGQILIIEDERDILRVIEYNLKREGFTVRGAVDGDEGLALVKKNKPDLILLDLMLPSRDGLTICRELKTNGATCDIPIIMVTAKGEESDIVVGLSLGADDYITKPFSIRELVARVRAVLRRTVRADSTGTSGTLTRGLLGIDAVRFRATVAGQTINLTATEFRLLHVLAAQPGRVFTRDQLLNHVVGEDVAVTDRNVDVHVRAVRKKLGSAAGMIETVRGVGYRFTEEYE